MKKLLAIVLAAILCLGLMAGCGQTTIIVNMGDDAEATPEATPPSLLPKTLRLPWLTIPRCPRVS